MADRDARRGFGARALIAAGAILLAIGVTPANGAPLAVTLPAPLPPIRLLTVLTALHLVGLCFGLGGATMLDFWILRWLRWGGMPREIARMFEFISKVVTVGIAMLWLSGLGFLALYSLEAPEKLANPKIWAKVAVVIALTLNGLLIHALVLPRVLRDVSRPMLDGFSHASAGLFLVSGAVSGVSWYAAFALGVMRELNGAVSASAILAIWLVVLTAASLGAYLAWHVLRRITARRRAEFLPALEEIPGLGTGLPNQTRRLVAGWRKGGVALRGSRGRGEPAI